MIIDERTEFGTGLDFATEAGTTNIGDIIDMSDGNAFDRNVGQGQPVYCIVTISTAADGGATATGTLSFAVVSDSTTTIATDGTQTMHGETGPLLLGKLTAGAVLSIPLQMSGPSERYLGLQLVQAVEGEDDCVGTAFLSLDPHGWVSYPDATN